MEQINYNFFDFISDYEKVEFSDIKHSELKDCIIMYSSNFGIYKIELYSDNSFHYLRRVFHKHLGEGNGIVTDDIWKSSKLRSHEFHRVIELAKRTLKQQVTYEVPAHGC